jgi:hypothetical protein
MTMRSRSRTLWVFALLLVGAGAGLALMTSSASSAHQGAEKPAAVVHPLEDKPLAAWRTELLDLAFSSASAIPATPHIKDRSRAQEAVVDTCLRLDLPQRALGYIEKIDNWRRGAGYADLAFWCAQHGHEGDVQRYLDLAEAIAEHPEKLSSQYESDQSWRRDRIRATIARTHVWLGQTEAAAKFEAGMVDSEAGKLSAMKAARSDANAFDEQLHAVDAVVAKGEFDQVRNALEACAQLVTRFYADADRRSRAEEKIKSSWKRLPPQVQLDLTMELAGFALDHDDQLHALALVKDAQVILDGTQWIAEQKIPLISRLAGLRHRAGDPTAARREVDAALALFDAERAKIVNIYRAGVLRSLAETYESMGDNGAALSVYKRAIEEGVDNKNSRPRAEDLSATCASMAVNAAEPDASLRARQLAIRTGLAQPW